MTNKWFHLVEPDDSRPLHIEDVWTLPSVPKEVVEYLFRELVDQRGPEVLGSDPKPDVALFETGAQTCFRRGVEAAKMVLAEHERTARLNAPNLNAPSSPEFIAIQRTLAERLRPPTSTHLELMCGLAEFWGLGQPYTPRGVEWTPSESTKEGVARLIAASGCEFEPCLKAMTHKYWGPKFDAFVVRMVELGLVSPDVLIDFEFTIGMGALDRWRAKSFNSQQRDRDARDLESLSNWLRFAPSIALQALRRRLAESMDDKEVANLAIGAHEAATSALWTTSGIFPFDFRAAGQFAGAAVAVAGEIFQKYSRSNEDSRLRLAWIAWSRIAFDSRPKEMPDEQRNLFLRASQEVLGRLRPILRIAGSQEGVDLWDRATFSFEICSTALFMYGPLWPAMRAHLHLFRSLGTVAVADDLRYWPEMDRPNPPSLWSRIPSALSSLFHAYAKSAQETDPDLIDLRTQFARFLLDRLRRNEKTAPSSAADDCRMPTSSESTFTEPDAYWRVCSIRAVRELRVNPKGKGHHILLWSSRNDPDDDVCAAAKTACDELRRGPELPAGMSPRRSVVNAFWWLRQAHLLSLGHKVDPDGAKRTREKEARRTKEAEDHDRAS